MLNQSLADFLVDEKVKAISVKFKGTTKEYIYKTSDLSIAIGDKVLVVSPVEASGFAVAEVINDDCRDDLDFEKPKTELPKTELPPIPKSKKEKETIPPALEDVKAYCKERNRGVDAEKWHNFYAAKGWKIGDNKMVSWKAAVRTWEKTEVTDTIKKPTTYNIFTGG